MLKIHDIHKYSQKVVNGSLVLTATIPNIENYNMEITDDVMTLVPKKINLTDDQINKTSFTKSKILYSLVTTQSGVLITNKGTYFEMLEDIWKTMPTQQLLQNTLFDFKMSHEKGYNGFWWNDNMSMSIRLKNTNTCVKELVNMAKLNGYKVIMTIELKNKNFIEFNF